MIIGRGNTRAGFTLIELLVVVLIIGILAATAVPQYFRVVEKGRFAEAATCFSVIKGAQQRYLLKNNSFSPNPSSLSVGCPNPGKAFNGVALIATSSAYTATLTRRTPTPATYGAYVVTYVGPAGTMTCSVAACTEDLLP